MSTLRAFRAIVWLRWRLLKNSVTASRKRDSLEQISRALALVVPLAVIALSAGTFVAVCALGFFAGRMFAGGLLDNEPALLVMRLLVGILAFTIVSLAVMAPAQSALSRYTRLLLLPIHRRVLHAVEVLASLADPWMAVVAAGLVMFAVGLASGGRPVVGVAALVAGVLTVAVLACAASLASFLVGWLMRDRRRGELFTLLFVMAFSLLSFIPAFMAQSADEGRPQGRSGDRQRRSINVEEFDANLPRWTRYLPSELHARTMAGALESNRSSVLMGLVALGAEAVVLFLASGRVHRQMLNSLEGDQSRRRSKTLRIGYRRLPPLSPGASAVAIALVRGAFRTVRGRLTVLLPGPMLAMLTAVFKTVPQDTWAADAAQYGFLLFGVSVIFTFYSMHAISMNFFGSDRAGLTLQWLAPITDRELAWGKIVGFAAIVGAGVAVCLVAALLVARSGSPAYWAAIGLGSIATFLLLAPMAVWFSALFPVASDLSKTGSGGNPHPLPMLVGTLATVAFSAPTVAILAAAHFWFKSPMLALPLTAVWLLVAAAIGIPLVNVAARAIGSRRENLALVAQGR